MRHGHFTTLVRELELRASGTKHQHAERVHVGRDTARGQARIFGVHEVWPLSLFFVVFTPWNPFPPWPLQPFPWGWSEQILWAPQDRNTQRLPTALVGMSQRTGPVQQLCAPSSEQLPARGIAQLRA